MGWLFTAIVEIFIEQVGEIIKWLLMVFDGVSIDIGYDTGSSQNSLFVADYFSGKETQGLFDRIFPQASSFFGVFLTLAYALVIVILVTEVYKAMVTTDTRNTESPISLVGKSLVSIFFVTFSYDIFIWFEKCANQFYLLFYELFSQSFLFINGFTKFSLHSGKLKNYVVYIYITPGHLESFQYEILIKLKMVSIF